MQSIRKRIIAAQERERARREEAMSAWKERQREVRRALELYDVQGAAAAVGSVAADAIPRITGRLFRASSQSEALGTPRPVVTTLLIGLW